MHDSLVHQLTDATLQEGGVTYDFTHGDYVPPKDLWYFPKHPSLTKVVGRDRLPAAIGVFITEHKDLLHEPDAAFGTWVDPDTHKIYIDINTFVKDRSAAITLAKELGRREGRDILSMYNPHRDETVYIQD